MSTRTSIKYERDPSCNLVVSNRLNPILVRTQQPVLPKSRAKASTSIGFVEEYDIQEKPSGVDAKTDYFLTTRLLRTNPGFEVAVRRSNSLIQDDRTLDAIHPEFDNVGVPVVAQGKLWENGVCGVVIEATVSKSRSRSSSKDQGGW